MTMNYNESTSNNYSIEFLNECVRLDVEAMPRGIRARLVSLFRRMEIFGSNLGMPHTRQIETGLFELRAMSQEGIGRVFYCTAIGKRIIVLHSFVKKSQKTPLKELEIARQRLAEVKNEAH